MNVYGNDPFSFPSASSDDEFMIKQLMLTHEPDGRRLDSELLLRAVEDVMRHSTAASNDDGSHLNVYEMDDDMSSIEIVGSEETLPQILWTILNEVIYKCTGKGDLHSRTMILFDSLGKYGWDAKIVLALAAFARCYGKFWVVMRQYHRHPLAVPIAMLRQFPVINIGKLKPQFKALSLLVKTMIDVAKCIIKFEGLPFRFVKLDDEAMSTRKSCIYVAAYWVARSTLACSAQIKVLKANVPEYSSSVATAAWELVSLWNRLNSICNNLRRQVDLCRQQIEMKMYLKLSESFQETHVDNQEVLAILLGLQDDFPLKGRDPQAKLAASELKDKVVVLLISKPELLPVERLLLLVQQTEDHLHQHEIVWIPISTSDTWSKADVEMFKFLSNSLPWYSLRKPWALSSVVVKYIKQEWDYNDDDDPIMVVLDSKGKVSHLNALDMVLLWGVVAAFPFSSLKENELWDKESWSLQFLVDEIDPLLNRWVDEGRNICLYGSDNLEWIREFNAKIKQIRSSGVQLEILYVGSRNHNEKVRRHILAIINEELHSNLLSSTKLSFFWLRLESMRRSKLRQGKEIDSDHVLTEVTALLDTDDDDDHQGWALVGEGSRADVIKLQGNTGMECLSRFSEWAGNVADLGFLGALKAELDPTPPVGPCYHSDKIPFVDGSVEGTVLCSNCSRPVKPYIIYE